MENTRLHIPILASAGGLDNLGAIPALAETVAAVFLSLTAQEAQPQMAHAVAQRHGDIANSKDAVTIEVLSRSAVEV